MKELQLPAIKKPNKVISYWKAEWRIVLLIVITGIIYNGSMELGPILQGKVIDLIAPMVVMIATAIAASGGF